MTEPAPPRDHDAFGAAPEADADAPPSALEAYEATQPTERDLLRKQLFDARREKSWATGWLIAVGVGPAALLAVLLAIIVEGSAPLAIAFAVAGAAMLMLKASRAERKIRQLERELEDPMDGS